MNEERRGKEGRVGVIMMRGKEEGSKISAAPTWIAGAAMPLAVQPLINMDTQCRERPGFMPEATVCV